MKRLILALIAAFGAVASHAEVVRAPHLRVQVNGCPGGAVLARAIERLSQPGRRALSGTQRTQFSLLCTPTAHWEGGSRFYAYAYLMDALEEVQVGKRKVTKRIIASAASDLGSHDWILKDLERMVPAVTNSVQLLAQSQ